MHLLIYQKRKRKREKKKKKKRKNQYLDINGNVKGSKCCTLSSIARGFKISNYPKSYGGHSNDF
jgi:hypothetical protein